MSQYLRFSLPAVVALTLSAALFSPVALAQGADAGVRSSTNSNIDDATRSKAMGGQSSSASTSSSSSNAGTGSKVENAMGRAARGTKRAGNRALGAVKRGAAKADAKIQGATGGAKGNAQSAEPAIKP